jgi:hypothetical protein
VGINYINEKGGERRRMERSKREVKKGGGQGGMEGEKRGRKGKATNITESKNREVGKEGRKKT